MKQKQQKNQIEIFHFLKSLTWTKEDLSSHPLFNKSYNQFMINRYLSMTSDIKCIILAMYLTTKEMSKLEHYKFLLYELPKKQIYFKYQKGGIQEDKKLINALKKCYNISTEKCLEFVNFLKENQINEILKIYGEK